MDFSRTRLSWQRPFWDYAKVQKVLSLLLRGRKFQLKRNALRTHLYLNIGCGPNTLDGFINVDYQWFPKLDLCWDITKGIPIANNSIKGIFCEHCLEHLSYTECTYVLSEFQRVLYPGGSVRIVVPDFEMYIMLYHMSKQKDKVVFPYVTDIMRAEGYTPLMALNRVFREHGHKVAFDYTTLQVCLNKAGFVDIQKLKYGEGRDVTLLQDSATRQIESLYVEATKL